MDVDLEQHIVMCPICWTKIYALSFRRLRQLPIVELTGQVELPSTLKIYAVLVLVLDEREHPPFYHGTSFYSADCV